jgi:hypothetical protein
MGESIAELERRVNELASQLRDAREALRIAQIEAAPVKIGDVVRSRGKIYRVTDIDPIYGHGRHPWLRGNFQRKDGSWSSAARNLYGDWSLVKP